MKKDTKTVIEEIDYVQDTIFVISGKWKLPILIALYNGVFRFRDIQRSVPPITPKILSKELKDLEQNKLIVRVVHDSMPVLIEYRLTEYAESLKNLITEMVNWGRNHRKKIKEE